MTDILNFLNMLNEDEIDNLNEDDVVKIMMERNELNYDYLHNLLNECC